MSSVCYAESNASICARGGGCEFGGVDKGDPIKHDRGMLWAG